MKDNIKTMEQTEERFKRLLKGQNSLNKRSEFAIMELCANKI